MCFHRRCYFPFNFDVVIHIYLIITVLFQSFNTASSNALGHVRKRSLSRGISLDESRQRQFQQQLHQQRLQTVTPNSTATTPTSGLGSASSNSNGHSPSSSRRLNVEEEERELRRQRRIRRRSDCQGMIPGSRADASPARTLHPTVIYSANATDHYGRLCNNGVVVSNVGSDESSLEDRKLSCR